MENGHPTTTSTTTGNDNDSLRRRTSLPQETPLAQNHRRSLSGGLLNRFAFLRSTPEDKSSPLSGQANVSAIVPQHEAGQRENNAMASVMRATKTRKRKGSLRKTALLGTGKLRLEKEVEGFNHANHQSLEDMEKSPPPSQQQSIGVLEASDNHGSEASDRNNTGPERFGYDNTYETSLTQLDLPSAVLTLDTTATTTTTTTTNTEGDKSPPQGPSPPSTLTSPITSPTSHYASTTDDDEGLTFSAPTITSAADLTRRRSARSTLGQSSSLVHVVAPDPRDHDYSDTEWWGWIILIITWIVFVVGMGSCLGVWSWAWDVGETPYAPPELEDDPTLPIVGYYPALIILTAVMAWVWVVVAWVGMKYFRHARFVDGVDGEE
ncbi:hypothetical protein EJ08DRAFT_647791 [Tothia fuscella]|uniref:Uncharacterized protein n=1 Tax=Tothia fuscella TaxID=1048955 RepID=A0A9P4NW27_9PEZI|nr:hypothetical protein EJ08DRAFT_647791 [Tothia fuscella]